MGLLSNISSSIFGLNDIIPRQFLYDYIDHTPKVYLGSDKDTNEFLDFVSVKHSLVAVLVLDESGRVLGSSTSKQVGDRAFVERLFGFLHEGLPDSDFVSVRSGNWFSFFRFKGNVIAVEAKDSLTIPELRAVARDLFTFVRG